MDEKSWLKIIGIKRCFKNKLLVSTALPGKKKKKNGCR